MISGERISPFSAIICNICSGYRCQRRNSCDDLGTSVQDAYIDPSGNVTEENVNYPRSWLHRYTGQMSIGDKDHSRFQKLIAPLDSLISLPVTNSMICTRVMLLKSTLLKARADFLPSGDTFHWLAVTSRPADVTCYQLFERGGVNHVLIGNEFPFLHRQSSPKRDPGIYIVLGGGKDFVPISTGWFISVLWSIVRHIPA